MPIDELDQLAEMHRSGEITPLEYARGVADVLAMDDDEAMQAALGVRPVRPWVQMLKQELRNLDDDWNARKRKLMNPGGMSWFGNTPSYWKAVGPGIAAGVSGVVTLLALAVTPWGEPAAVGTLHMAKLGGLISVVGVILCLWNVVKAANYNRAVSDNMEQRYRLILRRCEAHYGRRPDPSAPSET